jgi:hypothetical protein
MKVVRRLIFYTVTWNTSTSNVDLTGHHIQLQCGIIAVFSTMQLGIITLRYGMVIASPWPVMLRFSDAPVVHENQQV